MQASRAERCINKRKADHHEHSHAGEHGHGAVDHGDHVHEVPHFCYKKGVSSWKPLRGAMLSCVSLKVSCCSVGAKRAASETNKGGMVLQAREQVEANAVAAEGDTAEKAKLTQALIKV